MRVLVATPYYPPEGGGLERYAQAVATRLAGRGHDVRVLTHTRREGGAGVAREGRVRVERLAPGRVVSNTPVRARLAGDVARRVRAWGADVVWAHTPVPFTAEMASLGARRAGAPWCVTYHSGALEGGTALTDAAAWLNRHTLERHLLGGASGLAAVSPFVAEKTLARWRDKVTLAPPGVDHDAFTPPAGHGLTGRVAYVGPVDAAYRWKGFHVLLDAFLRARERHPRLRLDVVGEGNLVEACRERARAAGAGAHVAFRGRLPLEKLVAVLQAADVAVLPSVSDAESFGMVLAEAQACGCAAVATTAGGARFTVREGETGVVVPKGDAAALADALVSLYDDADALGAMKRRAPAVARERFRWERTAEATEAMLEAAVTGA